MSKKATKGVSGIFRLCVVSAIMGMMAGCTEGEQNVILENSSSDVKSIVLTRPGSVTIRAIPSELPDHVNYTGSTTSITFDESTTVDGCQQYNYGMDSLMYSVSSVEEFDCPQTLPMRVKSMSGGSPIEEWRQSVPDMPFYSKRHMNGKQICFYRASNYNVQLTSGSDPACFNEVRPMLVLLMDYSNSDMNNYLSDAEKKWGELVFGNKYSQGNHYWDEVFDGKFRLQPVDETQGVQNNGVVQVRISKTRPTSGEYEIGTQGWVAEALDLASEYVRFDAYDADGDGVLTNDELSVLVVPYLSGSRIAGAWAQASIKLNHSINENGPVLENFLRTHHSYTSIGVTMHELGHHVFGWKHFVAPTDHGLMGMGAYKEDPIVTTLSNSSSHYSTRPTHPIGVNLMTAGFVEPTIITDSATVELRSAYTGDYNLISLPTTEGMLYLENRSADSYDQSIPFCGGHSGGVFMTEITQWMGPLRIAGIEERRDADFYTVGETSFCDFYSLPGANDSFSYGGYFFSNFQGGGDTIELTITKENTQAVVDNYKLRWWGNDDERGEGWRKRYFEKMNDNDEVIIDIANVPSNTFDNGGLFLTAQAFYNTGEMRIANMETNWSTDSDYVSLHFTTNTSHLNGDKYKYVYVRINDGATRESTAIIHVSHPHGTTDIRLINLP